MRTSDNRRQFLEHSGLAAFALALEFLRPHALAAGARPRADACILVFLNGGMSHLDTFDPKPGQPTHIRGEFSTIRTSAPGILVTEHLPRMARQMHRCAVLRSVGFEGKLGNHSPACYHLLTGQEPQGESAVLAPPRPDDQPTLGAGVARFRPTSGAVPAFVMVPDVLIENAHLTPGQFAGWLGSRYEAMRLTGDPSRADFAVPALARAADVPDARLASRRSLLNRLEAARPATTARAGREMGAYYGRAFGLLTGTKAQAAFDIHREPARVRQRYGMDKFGQSVLLARRMVEAGVRFVNVHWPNVGGGANWDTHSNGFNRLKNALLPPTDRALSALIEDLAVRGLLSRTLVVVMTEFGRAPQIGKTFQNSGGPGGRDHWSNCFSLVLAGGGVRGGQVYGASDAKGAWPAEKPLSPADVVATIYHAMGVDPRAELADVEGRTHTLCSGTPVTELF